VPVEEIKDSFERVKLSVQVLRSLCDLQVTVVNDIEPVLVEVWKSNWGSAHGATIQQIEAPTWSDIGQEFNTTASLKRLMTDDNFFVELQVSRRLH
jgi:hypothetical protein